MPDEKDPQEVPFVEGGNPDAMPREPGMKHPGEDMSEEV
jgi:hypothetical protein